MNHSDRQDKVVSPTLHFYHYILRNSINESPEDVQKRRKFFNENLKKIASHLITSTGKSGEDIVRLIPIEKEYYGTVLDFDNVPPEYRKLNNDRLYFESGIIHSRLAARRFNDTYFLRLTRYVPSVQGEQPLELFANLGEHLNTLDVELGQTVILAGILSSQSQSTDAIAAECLSHYYSKTISPNELIVNEFLDCPFYVYPQTVTLNQVGEDFIESKKLTCVFLYKDEQVENQANTIYNILQNLLLSYHKIHFFYSQSLILEKILAKQYEAIERLTSDYAQQKWDRRSLLKLPQESLKYFQRLSFLEDQARLVEVQQSNYRECLEQLEQKTGHKAAVFFTDFEKDIAFYLKQMKANIGSLSPGALLYEKLMLSVQIQVSMSEDATARKILILAAIPAGLRLDKEVRSIEDSIRRAVRREQFEIKIRTAVRPQDIRRAIAEEQPYIVHFCGHGTSDGCLVLEDDSGNHKSITPQGLAALFKLHREYVNCVVLNACYSEKPAHEISQHVNYAIGMNQPIGDEAAIVFAVGFYDGLGYDSEDNVMRAYEEGLVAVQMEDLPQGSIPVLKRKAFDHT